MFFNKIFAAGALLTFAAAVPLQQHEQRDVVWTTSVVEDFVTVAVTTTIWVQPGETPAAQAQAQGQVGKHAVHRHGHHQKHHKQRTTHVMHTVTVHPSPAAPPQTVATAAAPSSPPPAAPPAAPSAPTSPAAPPAAPTSPTSPAAPAPTTGGGGGGSAPSGQKMSGDITFYTPGLGSCGVTNTESDMIVAVAEDIMSQWTGNPNLNPNCGKSITISVGGKTAVATVEDTCPGCAGGGLDLTPTLFQVFAPLSVGRVQNMEWWFN